MPKDFTCPNCGAPLDPPQAAAAATMRCPFCNTSVVIPEELRAASASAETPAWQGLEGVLGQAQHLAVIKRLADKGQLVEAIKLYRETFDTSLTDAKQAVEALAAGRPVQITSGTTVQSRVVESFTAPDVTAPVTAPDSSTRRGRPLAIVMALVLLVLGLGVGLFFTVSKSGVPAALAGFASQQLHFGGEGTGPGLFEDARAIAVDPDGRIYAAEYSGGRVQIFGADGKFITQWMIGDKHTSISALAADHSGHIFMVHDSELFEYDAASGKEVGQWEHPDGWGMEDAVATLDGGVVAAWYKNRDDIVRFNNDGQPALVIQAAISTAADDSELDTRVAVDGQGDIYALGSFTNAVFKFSPAGKFVARFGSDGDQPGQFTAPGAIAVDGQGRVYVSDFKGVQVFDGDGRYLDVIPLAGYAYGLTFDDQGFLYVSLGKEIVKYRINK